MAHTKGILPAPPPPPLHSICLSLSLSFSLSLPFASAWLQRQQHEGVGARWGWYTCTSDLSGKNPPKGAVITLAHAQPCSWKLVTAWNSRILSNVLMKVMTILTMFLFVFAPCLQKADRATSLQPSGLLLGFVVLWDLCLFPLLFCREP